MRNATILLVGWGEGEKTVPRFKEGLPCSDDGKWRLLERNVHSPPSPSQAEQLQSALKFESPDIILLVLDPDAAQRRVAECSQFFELIRAKSRLPVLALCMAPKLVEVEELGRFGALEVFGSVEDAWRGLVRLSPGADPVAKESATIGQLRRRLGLNRIVGESPAFVAVLQQIPAIAKFDVCALIQGETGTGKEVFARAIHYHSSRASRPFVPVNCGAIPAELLENEFFGHESGAFTSAVSCRHGVIHEANGGTLFLDEVDCLPPAAQVKLLRFLQDGQFRPLGSEKILSSNVRVIAASNIDLRAAQEAGRFRKDLYYRLDVISLHLPPLRERGEDIPLLARHFLAKYSAQLGTAPRELSPGALRKLMDYDWPGNVRELENAIQRAVVIAAGAIIGPEDIRLGQSASSQSMPAAQTFRLLKAKAIQDFERTYVRRLLAAHEGNVTRAAASAGKDRRAFWELMRKHQIKATPPISGLRPA